MPKNPQTNRNLQKGTETDRNGQKQKKKTDKHGQPLDKKKTPALKCLTRNRQKKTKTDSY